MNADDPLHQTNQQKWRTVAGCGCPWCESARAERRRNYKLRRRAHTDAALVVNHVEKLIEAGWSQSEIATASGVSNATISELRRGRYDRVRVTNAAALLGVTGPPPNTLSIPAIGSIRRIQALSRLGWTVRETCRTAGLSERFYAELIDKNRDTISRASADAIADVYNERCMTVPPMNPHRRRSRSIAVKHQWPPPLAYGDIDDPDEVPSGWEYRAADRAAVVRELAEHGENATHIARRLHISVSALERWCQRHLPDVWRLIATREGDWNSTGNLGHQSRRGDAA